MASTTAEQDQPQLSPRSKRGFKVCVKCHEKKPLDKFPIHSNETGELGSYCRRCKNELGKQRRIFDADARLRHYIVTRIKNEWPKEKVPADIHTNLEEYLGYKMFQLKKHLRNELKEREGITLIKSFKEGYHMDHIKPHSSFKKGEIGDADFKACWHYTNMAMIAASVNLSKGKKDAEEFY